MVIDMNVHPPRTISVVATTSEAVTEGHTTS